LSFLSAALSIIFQYIVPISVCIISHIFS
jgi:hypothetical protein